MSVTDIRNTEMNISDIVTNILSFVNSTTRYNRVSSVWDVAQQISNRQLVSEIDIIYPRWRDIDMKSNHYNTRYNIQKFHLNLSLLQERWDIFTEILLYHDIDVIPIALGILHVFRRHDISERIIKYYGYSTILSMFRKHRLSIEYSYPILYMMWHMDYPAKEAYTKKWISRSADHIHMLIGYVHPHMKEHILGSESTHPRYQLIVNIYNGRTGGIPMYVRPIFDKISFDSDKSIYSLGLYLYGPSIAPIIDRELVEQIEKYDGGYIGLSSNPIACMRKNAHLSTLWTPSEAQKLAIAMRDKQYIYKFYS